MLKDRTQIAFNTKKKNYIIQTVCKIILNNKHKIGIAEIGKSDNFPIFSVIYNTIYFWHSYFVNNKEKKKADLNILVHTYSPFIMNNNHTQIGYT